MVVPAQLQAVVPRPPGPAARLLIVDDEASIREGLQELVHIALGIEVDVAADAEQAIQKANRPGGYDLVITDQRMPGMQGMELLSVLLRRNRCREYALMSAFYKEYIDLAKDELGNVRFFAKPLQIDEFLHFIEESLAAGSQPSSTSAPA